MTLLYYDPVFLEHRTGRHPESAERLRVVADHLTSAGMTSRCRRPEWSPATASQLHLVHDPRYVAQVEQFCRAGGGMIEADTACSGRSAEAAALASGAVIDAVRRVASGEDRNALCLVRPPGHHALVDAPMGFCLYNHIAVGARLAVAELELNRLLIVDWDVHHGNGTQAIFWEEERVGFFSAHRWPFYPGSGWRDETGGGRGLGTKLNLPLEYGTSRHDYLSAFNAHLEKIVAKIRPEMILISAGFDSHARDPIGSLGLESEDFGPLTRGVLEAAEQYAGGKVVSVLEGGYHPPTLAECVEIHLAELLAASSSS